MDKSDVLNEIFAMGAICDFCNQPNGVIMRATLHPMLRRDANGSLWVTKVVVIRKCMLCIEEGDNDVKAVNRYYGG